MIKLVYCARRRSDITPEKFYDYWLNTHGPLVRGFAEAIRARKYIQSHTLQTDMNESLRASRGMEEPYDGITEVWWDSVADLQAAFATPEGREADRTLTEDE